MVSRVRTETNRAATVGRSLVKIGSGVALDPVDAYLRLLRRRRRPSPSWATRMSLENVERVLATRW